MDINIIHVNFDHALDMNFGLRSWSIIVSIPEDASRRTLRLDSLENLVPGDTVIVGGKVNAIKPSDAMNNMFVIDMDSAVNMNKTYVVQGTDIRTNAILLNTPVSEAVLPGQLVLRASGAPKVTFKSGLYYLAQYIQKTILTRKGSDKLDPNYGSLFYELVYNSKPSSDAQDIHANITSCVKDIEDYILKNQDANDGKRDKDELLSRLLVRDVYYDYNNQKWVTELLIVTQKNTSAIVAI